MVQSQMGIQALDLVLQGPTVNVTNAAADANALFRTGIATSLSPQIAMFIHQIDLNMALQTLPGLDLTQQNVWVLSEDLGATVATGELVDSRSLMVGGRSYYFDLTTSGMGAFSERLIEYISPVLPIVTIAQQLNFLVSAISPLGNAVSTDVFARLHYTLRRVSPQLMRQLVQRLNLSPQP